MTKVGFDDVPRIVRGSDAWQKAADEDEQAMAIACAVIDRYGDPAPHEWEVFCKERKIWRDHPAYQGALAGLRMARPTPSAKAVKAARRIVKSYPHAARIGDTLRLLAMSPDAVTVARALLDLAGDQT